MMFPFEAFCKYYIESPLPYEILREIFSFIFSVPRTNDHWYKITSLEGNCITYQRRAQKKGFSGITRWSYCKQEKTDRHAKKE